LHVQKFGKKWSHSVESWQGLTFELLCLVPDQNLFETISRRDYAERFAHKRIRVTGTLFFPMGGWHYITPVALEFGRVEVTE